MKKKNIDKKVALSIGGLSVLVWDFFSEPGI